MRIGIDARMYGINFTGIGRYIYELIDNLSKIDKENEYVIFLNKESFKTFKEPNSKFKKVLADFSYYSFSEQFLFLKLLNHNNLDLMHFCHFNAPIFYKKAYVVTIHDLTLSFFPGKKMNNIFRKLAYKLVLKLVTKHAKHIFAVSKNTKKDIINLLKVDSNKISVIYNGINPEFSKKTKVSRKDLFSNLNISKDYFLYTGVWRDHKNLLGLINAFSQFNKESRYQLVITGKYNPLYKEVVDLVKKLDLKDSIRLVGMVSENFLMALYQYSLAYVFPSFYEGFGLPVLEAMQSETPVLASNTSSIPEVCGEGNAIFFNPYNIDEIVNALYLISKDKKIRENLIKRGKDRVKDFSWFDMVKEILSVYNKVK